jgi:hypothetical protein
MLGFVGEFSQPPLNLARGNPRRYTLTGRGSERLRAEEATSKTAGVRLDKGTHESIWVRGFQTLFC